MRKFILSFFLVATAAIISAYTIFNEPQKKPSSEFFFQYVGSSYLEHHVENPANWIQVSDLTTGCFPPSNHRACRIRVSESVTNPGSPYRTLKSTTVIVTAPWGGDCYVINAGDVIEARNKE